MELIAMGEAARRLGVYPDTLVNWERRGLIKPIRDSVGRRLFTTEQLDAVIKKHRKNK